MSVPQIPGRWGALMPSSLEPVIFDNPEQLERAIDGACALLRRADAAKFQVLADDYERRALREPFLFSHTAGTQLGIAGGLRIAAALLESEAESS